MSRFGELIPIPTARFAVAAVALCLAAGMTATAPVPALLLANGALVLVAVIDAWFGAALGSVAVTRRFPEIAALGQEAPIAWIIENRGRRRVRCELADELAPSLGAAQRRFALTLAPGDSARATTTIRPSRRGRFTVAELALRVDGPLGLAARQRRERTHPAVLRVYPSFASRNEAELRINRARILDIGLRSAHGRGGGTDFDTLREYGPDDEFRRIDWAATARSGKAIVRTYRAERNQTVLLLLDTGRVMAGRVAAVPRLEHAMDAVMMLTAVATRLGDRAGLVAFDHEVRAVVPPSHSRGQFGRVTESMYQLEPRLVESDYPSAFTSALARFRRRALLVILTDLAEQAVIDTLVPALPLVVRDHLVVIASVQDPDVVAWASAAPADAHEAYRSAAAVAALEERRRLVARLRGMGATVVDAPPGKLAPELADTYLKVKATGRL